MNLRTCTCIVDYESLLFYMIGLGKWSNKGSWKKEKTRAIIVQIVVNHSSNAAFIEFVFSTGFIVYNILKLHIFMTCLVLPVATMNEPEWTHIWKY